MKELNVKENGRAVDFKGFLEIYEKDEHGEFTVLVKTQENLFVDDGKELTLDFLWGIASWWNYMDTGSYTSSNIGWNTTRYMGFGTCMFSNASQERVSGMTGIPSGEECSYPVAETLLVSPLDSFLSNEIGQRVACQITRADQTVEIMAQADVPGDIPVGTALREFGMFLKASGPATDPSYSNANKDRAMICRSTRKGTGYYGIGPGGCASVGSGSTGAVLCYYDDPYVVNADIQIRWKFGEC